MNCLLVHVRAEEEQYRHSPYSEVIYEMAAPGAVGLLADCLASRYDDSPMNS